MVVKIQLVKPGSEGERRGAGVYGALLIKALKKYFPTIKLSTDPRGDFDLVHYADFDFFQRTLPWRSPLPAVVTIHDAIPVLFPNHFPAGTKGRLNYWWQKHALANVKVIITDSKASQRDLLTALQVPAEKIRVIYLAVEPKFQPVKDQKRLQEVKKRYHLPDEFALFVGDLNWNKNIPGLVAVCQRLSIPLLVVGQAAVEMPSDPGNVWNRDRVAFRHRAEKDPKIITPGFVATEDLAVIYSLAKVYLQLSFYEGFGLPVLEAMACGCPVVAAETGSLPEVGGEAAILVDPTNLDHLTEVVSRVWQNQNLRQEMIEKGFSQAARFNWEKTAQETVAVYQDAVKKVS